MKHFLFTATRAHAYFCGVLKDFSSNLAHKTTFQPVNEQSQIHYLCFFNTYQQEKRPAVCFHPF